MRKWRSIGLSSRPTASRWHRREPEARTSVREGEREGGRGVLVLERMVTVEERKGCEKMEEGREGGKEDYVPVGETDSRPRP